MILDNSDKSFLRLVNDFSLAKNEIIQISQFVYKNNIVINPFKPTLQITNSEVNIAFDNSYIVELVDCDNNSVLNITEKVFINEFQDINGIYQLAFEILPIQVDFNFKQLFLRFTHTISNDVYWSNPINVTENIQTIRIDYKNYEYYEGISYDKVNLYQSIEIDAYVSGTAPKETTKIYTKLNGNIRSSRPIQAIEYTFNIDAIDSFTLDRLMVALNSELVYINGNRFVKSDSVSVDDRQGLSNLFPCNFKGQFIEKDVYNSSFQIAGNFNYSYLLPLGIYTQSNFIYSLVELSFNQNIKEVSYIKLYNYDTEEFVLNLPFNFNPNISPNLEVNFTTILPNGNYFVVTELNSVYDQELKILDKEVWNFSIVNGEYNNSEYNNLNYTIT